MDENTSEVFTVNNGHMELKKKKHALLTYFFEPRRARMLQQADYEIESLSVTSATYSGLICCAKFIFEYAINFLSGNCDK